MNKGAIAAIAALSCLELILQLIAILLGLPAAIICGALITLLSSFVFTFFELNFASWWPLIAQSGGASLGGVLLAWVTLPFRPALVFAPVAAIVAAGIVVFLRRLQAEQCALCRRRLSGEIAFQCPRCDLRVCERQCWSSIGCRCRLCDEHRVPILQTTAVGGIATSASAAPMADASFVSKAPPTPI